MADNVAITAGSGTTVAADDAAGVFYQKVKLVDGTTDSTSPIKSDTKSGALMCIDFAHHEVHAGDAFTASYTVDLAQSASADILIVVPNTTKWAHLTWEVGVEGQAHMSLWESVTATAAANAIVAYNRDRNSAVASGLVITHTPTSITTGSTLIRETHMGTGEKQGGSRSDNEEFILKQNVKYLLRITDHSGAANYIAVKLNWYEHTNL
jgi:hypothetical protein